MNYKRKPITVQALRWRGDNMMNIIEFVYGADKVLVSDVDGSLKLHSLDGYMTVHKDDWIIRTKHGEIYPCSDRAFGEIYETA